VASSEWIERLLGRAGLLSPAAAVVVACTSPSTGVLTWSRAGREPGDAFDAATPMYAASVTKQLIGVLVAQQVLAGRMRQDDRVVDLLPTLPPWAAPIRVRHLIHHTSGLPATARVLTAAGVDDEQHSTNDLVLQGIAALPVPSAPAGSVFAYSNVGYVVLAEALRALTGTALPVLARESLFRPLGMTASRLGSEEQPTLSTMTGPPRTVGDGGWWVSALDLLTWLDALNGDRLGADLTQLVQTPGRLDDGTALDYAWGVTARPSSAGTSYTHGGHWLGWSAKTVRRPNTGTAVALLTRSDDVQAVSDAGLALHESLPVQDTGGHRLSQRSHR
jgi:CubicO group peptidase (beta-lactamase class C family)